MHWLAGINLLTRAAACVGLGRLAPPCMVLLGWTSLTGPLRLIFHNLRLVVSLAMMLVYSLSLGELADIVLVSTILLLRSDGRGSCCGASSACVGTCRARTVGLSSWDGTHKVVDYVEIVVDDISAAKNVLTVHERACIALHIR